MVILKNIKRNKLDDVIACCICQHDKNVIMIVFLLIFNLFLSIDPGYLIFPRCSITLSSLLSSCARFGTQSLVCKLLPWYILPLLWYIFLYFGLFLPLPWYCTRPSTIYSGLCTTVGSTSCPLPINLMQEEDRNHEEEDSLMAQLQDDPPKKSSEPRKKSVSFVFPTDNFRLMAF